MSGGTWSFTTLPEAAIVSRTPASAATNVNPVSAGITATLTNASTASLAVTSGGCGGRRNIELQRVDGRRHLHADRGAPVGEDLLGDRDGQRQSAWWAEPGRSRRSRSRNVTARTPASSATNVNPATVQVTATLSGDALTASIALTLAGVAVPGTSTFNASTRVVTFTPTAQLDWAKTYTATVTANGTSADNGTWSFTTMAKPDQVSLFTTGTPTNANTTTALDIQVATRFRASVAGVVTAIRFYKGIAEHRHPHRLPVVVQRARGWRRSPSGTRRHPAGRRRRCPRRSA